jgi:hypothetical protein
MRLSVFAAGTALLLCQSAAMAQTNTTTNQPNAQPPANASQTADATANAKGSLRAQVREMLQREGFTDIHVVPSSLMIRAKDKDGNPVIMSVSADSFAEVSEAANSSSSDESPSNGSMSSNEPGGSQAGPAGSEFVSVPNNGELSSNVVGLDVYNNSKQNIGQIKDIAMGPHGRARAYIVSVGGFIGMGERYVAINPADIKVSYNNSDNKWHATMDATADQLKGAPEFKYTGRWNASKS